METVIAGRVVQLSGDLLGRSDLKIEPHYTYDMSRVTSIDSMTLGKFVYHVGRVNMINVPPKVLKVIRVLGLDKIIDVEPMMA